MENNEFFDAQKFAEILRRAQGNRTQRAFATACGISIPRMCNMINGKIDKPPTQKTLLKIANHAENGVTYRDLLLVAANEADNLAIEDAETDNENIALLPEDDAREITENKIRSLIQQAVKQNLRSCKVTPLGECWDFERGLLTYQVKEASIDLWQFYYIAGVDKGVSPYGKLMAEVKEALAKIVLNDYGNILDLGDPPAKLSSLSDLLIVANEITSKKPKISFVVTNNSDFESIKRYCKTPFLNILISVIQVDIEKIFDVTQEAYLNTGVSPNDYDSFKDFTF